MLYVVRTIATLAAMQCAPTFASDQSWLGSLSCASSAAAEDTDTAPEAMDVSERTRLPAVTACRNSAVSCRPKPGASRPTLYTCFTCRLAEWHRCQELMGLANL